MYIKRTLLTLLAICLFSMGAWAQYSPSHGYRGGDSYSQGRNHDRRHDRDKHRRREHHRREHHRHDHHRHDRDHRDYRDHGRR